MTDSARYLSGYPIGKPRVVRKAVRRDAQKQPKRAADRKLDLHLERFTARDAHICSLTGCDDPIEAGEVYVQVTDQRHADGPFIRGRRIATPVKRHVRCTPPAARPLIRLVGLPVPTTFTEERPA